MPRKKGNLYACSAQEVLEGNFELTSGEWEAFGLSGLMEEWDRPENDLWDEEFQRQNQS